MKRNFLFLLLVLTATINLIGQDSLMFYHKTYTTDDGLSSRFIQNIYHDSRNFIWVSTDYGVNQFDGQRFKVYNQGNYKLHSDNIQEIREDQAGNLWFINQLLKFENGVKFWYKISVDILDYQKDEIVSLEDYIGENVPFEWTNVRRIEQDEFDALWITTNEGKVYRYTDHLSEFPIDPELMIGGVLYPLANSRVLIFRPGRITKLNRSGEKLFDIEFDKTINKVVLGKNDQIYLAVKSNKFLYQIDNKGKLGMFKEEGQSVLGEGFKVDRFGTDSKGRLWFEGQDGKISLFDGEKRILNRDLERFKLIVNTNERFDFFGDKNGGIWYSDINGLNYISFNKMGFTNYFDDNNISLRGMFEISDSMIFVNSYSGYFVLNKYSGYYEPFEILDHFGYSKGGILLNGFIYNSLYDTKIAKINVEERTAEYIKFNTLLNNDNAKTFILGPDSTVLIGSTAGLYLLNPKIDSISNFNKYNKYEELKNLIINDFTEVEGLFYIQTNNGMYILDWEKGIIAHHNFVFNNLLYLYADKEGVFWIATRGGGLLEWHPEKNIIHQYTVDDGFSHNILYAVYGDTLDQLWLSSSKGLMRFNKTDKTVVTFLKSNGMKDNEFNQYSHYQDGKGKIYMGGVNGLVGFFPRDFSSIEKTKLESNIVATEITIARKDNKIYNLPANLVNGGEKLVIEGDVRTTNIKFSLLDYDRLEISQYYYKVEGIHDNWRPMEGQIVRLTGLPGGNHNILIKVNAGIKMESHYRSFSVKVLKPFTETWPFFGLCALGFLVLGISLSRYRIYRLDQINRRLERKVISRTKKIEDDKILISQQYLEMEQINKTKDHLIAIIGHDLKDYVSTFEGIEKKISYLISSQQVERIPQLAEFIENSAHDLSLLLDNLLNWALKERGDLLLHPDSVKVDSILRDVLKRLNKSIAQKEIKLISKIPENLNIYVDGLTLHSLFRNIIHNAIKFSYRKGIIEIYHTEKKDFISLHIKDHGIGISEQHIDQILINANAAASTRGTENEIGTGMGLLLCRDMLSMQSGKLKVASKTGKGTTFSILLPKRTSVPELENKCIDKGF